MHAQEPKPDHKPEPPTGTAIVGEVASAEVRATGDLALLPMLELTSCSKLCHDSATNIMCFYASTIYICGGLAPLLWGELHVPHFRSLFWAEANPLVVLNQLAS